MPAEAAAQNIEEPRPVRQRPTQPNVVRQQNPNLQATNNNATPAPKEGRIRRMRNAVGQKVVSTAEKIRDKLRSILRFEDPGDAEKKPILFPPAAPVHAAGNYIDGMFLSDIRTLENVAEPLGPATRAAYRTLTRPIPGFNFIDTIKHPFKYFSNPLKTLSSSIKAAANFAARVPRSLEEKSNRAGKRFLQNFGKIPLATPVSKIFGLVGKGLGAISTGVEKVRDISITKADNWVTSKQGLDDNTNNTVASAQG